MPTSKAWVMNCVLAGAQAFALLHQGKEAEARAVILNLTSEFDPEDVEFIIRRLKEVEQLMQ